MKAKNKRLFGALVAVITLCTLVGCQNGLITEKSVAAAAKESGLAEVLVKKEAFPDVEYCRDVYVLCDPANGNNSTLAFSSPNRIFPVLEINSLRDVSAQKPDFSWEDWKKLLVFAAQLSDRIADEEEFYRSFSCQTLPAAEKLPNEIICQLEWKAREDIFKWETELPDCYCRIEYRIIPAQTRNFQTAEYDGWKEQMTISVYESEAHYEGIEP